ncbi:MAG: hypothetical protein ACREBD_12705 [Blastocatellia bacterium]
MRMATISEAQQFLPQLITEAITEAIWLTDEDGNVVGVLAGLAEDDLDDLLVQTPEFRALIARSRASLQLEEAVSVQDLLAEARVEMERQQQLQ